MGGKQDALEPDGGLGSSSLARRFLRIAFPTYTGMEIATSGVLNGRKHEDQ